MLGLKLNHVSKGGLGQLLESLQTKSNFSKSCYSQISSDVAEN